ncbi:NAD(P)-dependent oxidoreductase [Blastococcus sp. CCUG 61487]|uniref:NAD(P)-dependent oxidoreductase n=1 Tax=Blastococcus sp. CCUG 61487 TaxID=1840703 RepID=UPI001134496A|nr:NAD(P)-dependent oxidoreductase [Blastococcus sp. CCUG 61487]TKJ21337.1 hypothetical protein A6V29_07630 [Blastococcus sp. CCUG 61487]
MSIAVTWDLAREFDALADAVGRNGRALRLVDNLEESRGCETLVVGHEVPIDKAALDAAPWIREVVRWGAGVDNIDVADARERGVEVRNVPDYGVDDVADHALMLLLASTRSVAGFDRALRADPVAAWRPDDARGLPRLSGSEVGVIGLGRIGSAIARRLLGFGCGVTFYDPYLARGAERSWGLRRAVSLIDLLESVDHVLVAVPLTKETRGLLGERELASIRPGATLVNVARGAVIDSTAVARALRARRLRAFAADVLECEPPDPNDELLTIHQGRADVPPGVVLLTPHIAGTSREARQALREGVAEHLNQNHR